MREPAYLPDTYNHRIVRVNDMTGADLDNIQRAGQRCQPICVSGWDRGRLQWSDLCGGYLQSPHRASGRDDRCQLGHLGRQGNGVNEFAFPAK